MANAGNNAYQTAANANNAAINGTAAAAGMPNTQAFMNPFTSSVTDRTMQDMERQRQMQMNNIGASATAAGAFGGSRHGVAESLTNEAFARQGADAFANLNMQGYNNALNAAQQQQGTQLAAAGQLGGLANQTFGMANNVADRQMAQGAMQQMLQQNLIDAARSQYAGFTGAPEASLQLPLAALGASPVPQSQTSSYNPGLFDYLTAGFKLFGI